MSIPEISSAQLKELMAEGAQKALFAQEKGDWKRTTKPDGTPVTTLDLELDELFCSRLPELLDIPVVSEEGDWQSLEGLSTFWCVDPLDGTYHYIRGSKDWALCVGLIWEGFPVLGALAAPAWGQTFFGAAGQGAELNGEPLILPQAPEPEDRMVLTSGAPSPRLQRLFHQLGLTLHESRGSVLKLAHLASGAGHFYPRFGVTSEWDTAAGQAVLEAMGGKVVDPRTFERLSYGKANFLNRGFLAWGPGVFTEEEVNSLQELVAQELKKPR